MLVAAVVFGGAYALPELSVVERHTVIAASPDRVFAALDELKDQSAWWDFSACDPAVAFNFSGSFSGLGQKMDWSSADPLIGKGQAEVIALEASKLVDLRVMGGIFKLADMRLAIAPVENGTGVTWTIRQPIPQLLQRWPRNVAAEQELSPGLVAGLERLKSQIEATNG